MTARHAARDAVRRAPADGLALLHAPWASKRVTNLIQIRAMKRIARNVCLAFCLAAPLPAVAAPRCPAPARPTLTAVPGDPFSALPTSDGCWLFVSLSDRHDHGSVAVLRDERGSFDLKRTVATSAAALGEALSPDGRLLAVTTLAGVDLLDVARLERPGGDPLVVRLTDGSPQPVYAAISRDNRLLFVSDETSHRISVFNLVLADSRRHRTAALVGHIPTAFGPVGLAVSPHGKWLYATSEVAPRVSGFPDRCSPPFDAYGRHQPVGVLLKIDIAKAAIDPRHSVVAGVPAGCQPVRVAVSPSGETLWVTARGDNALLRIPAADLNSGAGHLDTDSFPIGTDPVGLAVRPDDRQVWVADSARFVSGRSGRLAGLTGIHGKGKVELMSAAAKGFPRELNFLPDGRTLVVTLFSARAVEFMPTP